MTVVTIVGDGSHPASFAQSVGVATAVKLTAADLISYVGDVYPQGDQYCFEYGTSLPAGVNHGFDFVFGTRRADGVNLVPKIAFVPGNHEMETQTDPGMPAGRHSGDCTTGRPKGMESYFSRAAGVHVMDASGGLTGPLTTVSNRFADGGSMTKIRTTFDDGTAIPDNVNGVTQTRNDFFHDINGVRHVFIATAQLTDTVAGCSGHGDEGYFPKSTDTGLLLKRWQDVTGWINGAVGNACVIYAHHTPFSCGDQSAHPSGTNHTGLIALWQFCQGKVVMWCHGHWHSAWRTKYPFDANGAPAATTVNGDGSITSNGIWIVAQGNGGNSFNPNLYTGAANLANGLFPSNSTYVDYAVNNVYGLSTLVYANNTRLTFKAFSTGTTGSAAASQVGTTLVIATTAAGGGGDTTPPSAPTALHTTSVAAGSVALAWTASTDNIAAAGTLTYQVFRNGVQVGTTSAGVVTFTDTTVLASSTYNYTVKAVDPSGNVSGATAALVVNTPASSDVTAPTVPAALHTTSVAVAEVDIAWTASTDGGSGMARYRVYRDGVFLATVAVPAVVYRDTAVSANHTYSYTVSAVDVAGNESAQSGAASATTPPVTTGVKTLFGASGPQFTQAEITNEEAAIGRHIYLAQELYDWLDAVPVFAGGNDQWMGNRTPITYPILNILGRLLPGQSNFPGAALAAAGTFNDAEVTNIANGVYDAKLIAWRNYLAQLPQLHFIRPWREMTNGTHACAWATSTGAIFIAAWRRMYTIMKGNQAAYTAYNTNVNAAHPITAAPNPSANTLVMWCPAVWSGDYRPWFPGTAYVDIAGIDGYAWAAAGGGGNANGPAGTGGWHTFAENFSTFYGQFNKTNGTIAKLPIIVAEMNAEDGATVNQTTFNRAAWWADAQAALPSFPDIDGISIWISGTNLPGSNAPHGAAAYITFANAAILGATSLADTGGSGGGTPVAPTNPGGGALPQISDTTPAVAEQLHGTSGAWAGDTPIAFTGLWQRSADSGATWITISAGLTTTQFTNDTMTVQSGWSGQIIRFTVTASNAAGSGTATSANTSAVAAVGVAPTNAGGAALPTVNDATPVVGQTITGSAGQWAGTTPITFTGLWEVAATSAGPWTPATGIVRTTVIQNDTYVVANADFGQVLRFTVTAVNTIGSAIASSIATSSINRAPINDVVPSIVATNDPPQVGDLATASPGTWH